MAAGAGGPGLFKMTPEGDFCGAVSTDKTSKIYNKQVYKRYLLQSDQVWAFCKKVNPISLKERGKASGNICLRAVIRCSSICTNNSEANRQ